MELFSIRIQRTFQLVSTEYVHNPCFLSANILKILGVFAENQ